MSESVIYRKKIYIRWKKIAKAIEIISLNIIFNFEIIQFIHIKFCLFVDDKFERNECNYLNHIKKSIYIISFAKI